MIATLPRTAITRQTLTQALLLELDPLIRANHAAAETGAPLAPDWWQLARMGLWLWVVRVDGRAVGYCAHVVSRHPFAGEQWATCAAVYLDPAHRGLVRQMVRQIERDLAGQVAVITYSVPHLSRAGAFFEAMGYPCAELVMQKRLETPL